MLQTSTTGRWARSHSGTQVAQTTRQRYRPTLPSSPRQYCSRGMYQAPRQLKAAPTCTRRAGLGSECDAPPPSTWTGPLSLSRSYKTRNQLGHQEYSTHPAESFKLCAAGTHTCSSRPTRGLRCTTLFFNPSGILLQCLLINKCVQVNGHDSFPY